MIDAWSPDQPYQQWCKQNIFKTDWCVFEFGYKPWLLFSIFLTILKAGIPYFIQEFLTSNFTNFVGSIWKGKKCQIQQTFTIFCVFELCEKSSSNCREICITTLECKQTFTYFLLIWQINPEHPNRNMILSIRPRIK